MGALPPLSRQLPLHPNQTNLCCCARWHLKKVGYLGYAAGVRVLCAHAMRNFHASMAFDTR